MAAFGLEACLELPPVCFYVPTTSLSSSVRASVYSVLIFLNILSGALTVLLLLAWPDPTEAKHRQNTQICHLFRFVHTIRLSIC